MNGMSVVSGVVGGFCFGTGFILASLAFKYFFHVGIC